MSITLPLTYSFRATLGEAISVSEVTVDVSYREKTTTPSISWPAGTVLLDDTAAATLVAAPTGTNERFIESVHVYNSDTISHTLTFDKYATATAYPIKKLTLGSNESATYEDGVGWKKYSASGAEITSGIAGADGADGADGVAAVTETEIDFGSTPVLTKAFTVTDAAVSTSSKIIAVQSGKAATGRDADENEMDNITFSANPGTGSFTLYATAHDGRVSGTYKVNYVLS